MTVTATHIKTLLGWGIIGFFWWRFSWDLALVVSLLFLMIGYEANRLDNAISVEANRADTSGRSSARNRARRGSDPNVH